MSEPYQPEKCQRCGERDATEMWCEEGSIAFAHGMLQEWCRRCVVTEQLAHARKMADNIPRLEAELAALGDVNG